MSRYMERDLLARPDEQLARRDFLKLGVTTAGALALAACGGSTGARSSGPTGPDFKIGAILPSSGTYAELGDSIRKGMQLYLEKVASQAGNRRIVITDEDEAAGDTTIPLTKARKLVEQDGVDLIAGIVASPNALALRAYVDQNQVPTLIANAGANALSRAQKSPWVYRTSFSNWQPSQPMGRYLVDNGIRRLTLVYSNYAAGLETAAAIKETYTGQILTEVKPPFPNTSGDFAPFITQVNSSRPDAIYVFMSGQDAINFLKQAKTQLDKSIRVTGSGFFVEQDVLSAIGDAAPIGALTGLHWALTLANNENKDFTDAFKKRFGKTADVFAVQGYDTARVIVEALDAVRGSTTDRAAFMRAIAKVSFKSPRGDFKFDENSHNVVNTIYVRELVSDSRLGATNRVTSSMPNVVDPGK